MMSAICEMGMETSRMAQANETEGGKWKIWIA